MKKLINSVLTAALAFAIIQGLSSQAEAGLCEANREQINKAQANLNTLEKLFGQGAVSRVMVLQAEKQLLDVKLCQDSYDQDAFAALVNNVRARQSIVYAMSKSGIDATALDAVLIDGELASLTNACEAYKNAILERFNAGEKKAAAVTTINSICATLGK